MLIARNRYALVALVAVLLVTVAVVWSTRPAPDSALAAMLKQASENSIQMESFQYSLTGSQTWDSGATEEGTLLGQMELPDKNYGRDYDANGILLRETKMIGGSHYSREGGAGLWKESILPESPFVGSPASVAASSLVDSALEFLTDVTLVGEEQENGVTVAHFRGTTDMATKAATVYWPNWDDLPADSRDALADARQQYLSAIETVDVWIDKDNNLLLRTTTTATLPAVGDEEGYSVEGTMEFSGYNEAFNISAPARGEIERTQ